MVLNLTDTCGAKCNKHKQAYQVGESGFEEMEGCEGLIHVSLCIPAEEMLWCCLEVCAMGVSKTLCSTYTAMGNMNEALNGRNVKKRI